MFPIDVETKEYRQDIAKTFNQLFSEMGYHQDILETNEYNQQVWSYNLL
jgi:hypothetical protein